MSLEPKPVVARGLLRALRHANYRRYFFGQAVSWSAPGCQANRVGLGRIAVDRRRLLMA